MQLSKNGKSGELAISLSKGTEWLDRANAGETSRSLYQEISHTSVTLKNLNLTEQTCRADKQEGQQKQAINIRCGENGAHAKPCRSTLLGLIVHPLQRADPQALSFCSAMANEQMSAPRDLVVFD